MAVASRLEASGIKTFWPTCREAVRWSDRDQISVRSLFPGYLFAYFEASPVFVAGTIQILNEPVDSGQIDAIRRAVDHSGKITPTPYVSGATVRIRRGPFAGCEGVIERVKGAGRRLILRIDLLQRAVAVELDTSIVRP